MFRCSAPWEVLIRARHQSEEMCTLLRDHMCLLNSQSNGWTLQSCLSLWGEIRQKRKSWVELENSFFKICNQNIKGPIISSVCERTKELQSRFVPDHTRERTPWKVCLIRQQHKLWFYKCTKMKFFTDRCMCVCTLWLLWSNAQSAEAAIQRVSISLLSREQSKTFMALSGRKTFR